MQLTQTGPLYSASDLISYTSCLHLVGLDRAVAEGRLEPPDQRDSAADLAIARGMDREHATRRQAVSRASNLVASWAAGWQTNEAITIRPQAPT